MVLQVEQEGVVIDTKCRLSLACEVSIPRFSELLGCY